MRVGISLCSSYLVADPREGARYMIERAAAAREAGLDSLFVGDHHSVPIPYYQNVPILGRLLAEWDERPAGALFLLPLWNPVLVADRAARMGEAWLAAPALVPNDARKSLDLYRESCDRHGRKPTAIPIRRDVYVGSSDAEAQQTTAETVARGYRGFSPEALVIGGVETVADAFFELADMGYTDVIVRNLMSDQAAALRCIENLAHLRELLHAS